MRFCWPIFSPFMSIQLNTAILFPIDPCSLLWGRLWLVSPCFRFLLLVNVQKQKSHFTPSSLLKLPTSKLSARLSFPYFWATLCKNCRSIFFYGVSAKYQKPSTGTFTLFPSLFISHFFFFPNPPPLPSLTLWFLSFPPFPCSRLTVWRWAGWAKHRSLFPAGQTVHSLELRMAPQTHSAQSRPSPSCSRKSSSSRSNSRSSRRPGTTTLPNTSNWPTTPTSSRARALNRWEGTIFELLIWRLIQDTNWLVVLTGNRDTPARYLLSGFI